jgi:signal transduction histidine kinase
MLYRQEILGLILIGMNEKAFSHFNSQWTSLRLLANHAAICFHLERIRTEQAEQLAAERLQTASLTARKIAHEINNPLAILRNYLHILGKKSKQGEPISDELAILDNELERLGHITLGLEDLSREQDEIQMERLDLHRLIEDTLHLFQTGLDPVSRIEFSFAPWPQPIFIQSDRRRLSQILQNLLGNAADAIAGQGEIVVRTNMEDDHALRVEVEDNGPGIDPSLEATLFSSGTSTKDGRHGGLGLAIVHKLATQLGGTVSYRSQPGQTVFTLILPKNLVSIR